MEIGDITIKGDRKCSAEELKEKLKNLGVILTGSFSRLTAYVGLEHTVYIEPFNGEVTKVELKGDFKDISCYKDCMLFNDEKRQRYKVKYFPPEQNHISRSK